MHGTHGECFKVERRGQTARRLLGVGLAAGFVGGCASLGGAGGWGGQAKGGTRLDPAAFKGSAPTAAAAPAEAAEPVVTAPAPTAETVPPGPEEIKVVSRTGLAPVPEAAAAIDGRDVLADCMVGQINGKPVFASEILDPLDGQLRRMAVDAKGPAGLRDWAQGANGLIMGALRDRVRDELLLGEARTRLSVEQRQGLIFFLERLDQYLSGQTGGSREEAAAKITAQTGDSYEKFLQDFRDKQLIRELVEQNVTPNVRVPWRKVERFYNENSDLFNPPAKGVVRIVMIDGSDAAAVTKAEAIVAARDQEAFALLAGSVMNKDAELRATAGRVERPLDGPGGYEGITWVPNPRWNQAAATLSPGGFAGPVEAAGFKVWIMRAADVPAQSKDLEEAQLQVFAALKAAKQREEESVFLSSLLGKSSLTPVNSMLIELLVLAGQRHLSPELSGRLRDLAPSAAGLEPKPELERSPVPAGVGPGPAPAAPAPASPAGSPK